MGLHFRLTLAFILCVFEYASLGILSLEPSRQILHKHFPYDSNTTDSSTSEADTDDGSEVSVDSGSFQADAAAAGFAFNTTGWIIAFSYVGMMVIVLLCYVYIYIKEMGYGCVCSPSRYATFNQHCCTRCCGKSFLLMWVLYPVHAACLIFIVYWDIQELQHEQSETHQVTLKHHEFLTNMAFFFGDVLLLKHVLVKWQSLRTRDLRVSLFLETHVHLDAFAAGIRSHHAPGLHASHDDHLDGGDEDGGQHQHQPRTASHTRSHPPPPSPYLDGSGGERGEDERQPLLWAHGARSQPHSTRDTARSINAEPDPGTTPPAWAAPSMLGRGGSSLGAGSSAGDSLGMGPVQYGSVIRLKDVV